MGLVTRGGCAAACPQLGLVCWGCRGPAKNARSKIAAGETLDHVFATSLSKRARLSPDVAASHVRDIHGAGHTALSMPHDVSVGEERIR
jgi:coenzyme F420-reducing hydrogenase gamma subunit